MPFKKSRLVNLIILFPLLLSCRVWSSAPVRLQAGAGAAVEISLADPVQEAPLSVDPSSELETLQVLETVDVDVPEPPAQELAQVRLGSPAGCLDAQAQAALASVPDMLAYADRLIELDRPLAERVLTGAWNGYTQRYLYDADSALTLDVADVKNEYVLQRMLNVLHVAGFVAWLRDSARPDQDVHILALPLVNENWAQSDWAPYIQAYWQGPQSTPEGDPFTRLELKLPPCAWMVERGFAPQVDAGWWAQNETGWPDYARAAEPYLASTSQEANRVARQIDWLGAQLEAADTMCGPLSWSILRDAGAFPPGNGAWLDGSITFWLAKPTTNGRPWSLFPSGTFTVYHFDQPIGEFDFQAWPLVPGDFLYTYSEKDGFDHMFVVTEVDAQGNIYSVTNLVQEEPEKKVVIERALLLNLYDRGPGLIHNDWRDRTKGRTGQAGFDVFRWDWMVKDIEGQAVEYTVQPGDTLSLVSIRWKTPADWIARYNQLEGDASLAVGQLLSIPPNEHR